MKRSYQSVVEKHKKQKAEEEKWTQKTANELDLVHLVRNVRLTHAKLTSYLFYLLIYFTCLDI